MSLGPYIGSLFAAQLRAIPFPAGPTALPSQLATNPKTATGPVSTNVAPATSPAINAHTPRAGASYHSEDV